MEAATSLLGAMSLRHLWPAVSSSQRPGGSGDRRWLRAGCRGPGPAGGMLGPPQGAEAGVTEPPALSGPHGARRFFPGSQQWDPWQGPTRAPVSAAAGAQELLWGQGRARKACLGGQVPCPRQVPSSAATVTPGAASVALKPAKGRRLSGWNASQGGQGRAEACRARRTGKARDNSGWNRWRLSHLRGPPSACEVEGRAARASGLLTLLCAQGGRPGHPPALPPWRGGKDLCPEGL